MLLTLAVHGYRSLRDLVVPLERLTVITGANGSGKSSLYRSVRLLADVAQGNVVAALAREGGLPSTLWAGPEAISRAMKAGDTQVQGTVRRNRVALKLGFASEDYGYAINLGLPSAAPGSTAFARDPEIKVEIVWAGEKPARSNTFARRRGPIVEVLDGGGRWRLATDRLAPFDSMMTHAADPTSATELLAVREGMRAWRFYDHLRTDRDAPTRRSQVGTRTPALAADGGDLPAAIQTIREIGDAVGFDEAVADAFPGSLVEVRVLDGLFSLTMRQPGLLRPLEASELSDGTLRYMLLAAALFSPRPPPLMVLNEPETSLHPDVIDPVSRLIHRASDHAQIIVVSHDRRLVQALAEAGAQRLDLAKELGETAVKGVDPPAWGWPRR